MRDDKGHVTRVPAQPSSDSLSSGNAPDDSLSSSSAVLRPRAWTSFWASGSSPATGSLRVTDIVLRIGPDAAIVWTLDNFPAGLSCIGLPGRPTSVICCKFCCYPLCLQLSSISSADRPGRQCCISASCNPQPLDRGYLVLELKVPSVGTFSFMIEVPAGV